MSILIKNMKMPDTCEDCNLESFCDLWVDARKMCGEWKPGVKATIRHPDCPLIYISPHGNLIDADALIADKWYLMKVVYGTKESRGGRVMGVYIKGMEMPKSCNDCPLNYDSIDCMVADNALRGNGDGDFLFDHERHPNCPLVPVSSHGRLIDADAFSAKIIELLTNLQNCYDCYCEGCKYKHLLEPGNFVKCMNALIKESADVIETLQMYVDLYKDITDTRQKTARELITPPVKHGIRLSKKEN